ncbi:major capsid protein [Burkholderia multivorans]|uniref:major capsid protein n=1 Tax=Burkholderia multivorans TaxID=87883 RepID=UPI001C257DE4|nr:major capsid protein [Burkholderia multivorans]MBU9542855.1 hypothetical protein [Burkholderia multivorans]
MKNLKQKLAIGAGALTVAGSSFAAGPDFTSLTTAVDFSTAITSVLAVGANVALVYVAIKGFKLIMGAIKG